MMEPIKINIKSGVEHFKSLDISEIIEYNGNYHLVLNEDIKDINVGQTIFYIRNIQKDADKYDDITESGEIVEIMDSKNIVITPPPNYIYIIKKIQETDEGLYRVSLSEEHNIFQQDIEESGNQCVYFYDENGREKMCRVEKTEYKKYLSGEPESVYVMVTMQFAAWYVRLWKYTHSLSTHDIYRNDWDYYTKQECDFATVLLLCC